MFFLCSSVQILDCYVISTCVQTCTNCPQLTSPVYTAYNKHRKHAPLISAPWLQIT